MKNLLVKLWRDERAFVMSAEIVLIGTVAILAVIIGLAAYRDAIIAELTDNAHAVGALNQSYSIAVAANGADPNLAPAITVAGNVVTVTRNYGPIGNPLVIVTATFNNFSYQDNPDFCEDCTIAYVAGAGATEADPALAPSP